MTREARLPGIAGQRLLISGGLGALGQVIVKRLAKAGAHVVINDVVPRDELSNPTGAVDYVAADAAEPGAAAMILDATTAALGGLPDTVCCHAGIVIARSILDYTLDEVEAVWRTNVLAQFALAQEASRRWVRAGQNGHLIFTGSWVADVPWPDISAYSSSKAALKSLARSFARELAPHGVRANLIAPGIVGAGMAQRQWDTEPEYQARAKKAIPLGALQSPRSVADAVLFLASDLAAYMTGSTLLVDGGASLYPMDDIAPPTQRSDPQGKQS